MKNLNFAQQTVILVVMLVMLTALILSALGVGGFTTSEFTNL